MSYNISHITPSNIDGFAIFFYYYGIKQISASVSTICELAFPLTAVHLSIFEEKPFEYCAMDRSFVADNKYDQCFHFKTYCFKIDSSFDIILILY